jgi:hypothetical protein
MRHLRILHVANAAESRKTKSRRVRKCKNPRKKLRDSDSVDVDEISRKFSYAVQSGEGGLNRIRNR